MLESRALKLHTNTVIPTYSSYSCLYAMLQEVINFRNPLFCACGTNILSVVADKYILVHIIELCAMTLKVEFGTNYAQVTAWYTCSE